MVPPRRTGHPGDDWNTFDPRVTMHPEVTNRSLLHQRVVLLKDSHFRTVPLAVTLPGYPYEPQPPRCPKPRGRSPPNTIWNYASASWTLLQQPDPSNLYEQVVSVERMITFAYEQDSGEHR